MVIRGRVLEFNCPSYERQMEGLISNDQPNINFQHPKNIDTHVDQFWSNQMFPFVMSNCPRLTVRICYLALVAIRPSQGRLWIRTSLPDRTVIVAITAH